jgi:YebC/PmpR family DNA-binding regulatory protein
LTPLLFAVPVTKTFSSMKNFSIKADMQLRMDTKARGVPGLRAENSISNRNQKIQTKNSRQPKKSFENPKITLLVTNLLTFVKKAHDHGNDKVLKACNTLLGHGLLPSKTHSEVIMGAQWKHQGKASSAAAKGAVIHKLTKEIQVAAKLGQPDPDYNPRLRAAIEAARKQSVTRDTIERAIKKGAGLDKDASQFETVTYEGFAPHKVPVIVECLTDNKNRTASEVKVLFRAGHMGTPGSVAWMFDHMGIIEAIHADKNQDFESAAIEAGAQNVEPLEKEEVGNEGIGARFFSDASDLDAVNKALTAMGWKVSKSELGYVPKNLVELNGEQEKEVVQFLQDLDDCDDVHRVYAGIK